MRVGVISDTHIPDRAKEIPQKILNDFKNVEMILHAGDLVDLLVLDKLKGACANVHAVFGNMDPSAVRKKLPEKEVIIAGRYRIGLMHGYGPPQNLIELLKKSFQDDFVNLVVFGHAHYPMNELRDNILYFNPGSATDKILAPFNSYGLIELNDKIEAKLIRL